MFMSLRTAEQIAEDFDNALSQHFECRAEAGMGAVSMGFDGYDGASVYDQTHDEPTPDAREREAFNVIRMFGGLRVHGADEYTLLGDVIVPEFAQDLSGVQLTDSIPF